MLLNVIAENFPQTILGLQKKIYKESVFHIKPYPHHSLRLNFGGVPFYYLYRDLPIANLQKLLSNIGVSLIFSISGIISLLLFTGLQVISKLKNLKLGCFNP